MNNMDTYWERYHRRKTKTYPTVFLSEDTKERLTKHKIKGNESYDSIVNRLLNRIEEN